jgi:hypothetical protein
MSSNPAERSMNASAAANTRWAFTKDRSAATATARKAFNDSLEKQVDPAGELSPDERARRAAMLRRAHMKRLAMRSAKSRRAAAGARQGAEASKLAARALTQAAADLECMAADTDAELGELKTGADTTGRQT